MNKYEKFEGLLAYETNNSSKERIVNAAIYQFATLGYASATTKGIAELADVSEALIFKHFGNKQKLLGIVSEEIVSIRLPKLVMYKLDELIQKSRSFSDHSFTDILKDKFAMISDNAGYFKIVLLELSYNSEEMMKEIQKILRGFLQQMEGFVVQLQKQNYVKEEIPARVIVRSFAGMLNFLLLDQNILESTHDIDEELEWIVYLFLKGVEKND